MYNIAGSYSLAIDSFKKAIESFNKVEDTSLKEQVFSNRIAVMQRLAEALSKNGDTAGAISEINQLLKEQPNYIWAFCGLSEIYNDSKEYAKAIDAAKKGLAIDSNNNECVYNLAMAYFKTGNSQEARPLLEKYLDLTENLAYLIPYKAMRLAVEEALSKIK